MYIIENSSKIINYTTASLPPTSQGFQTLKRIIHDDLQIKEEVLLFSKNGTEMNEEDFFHIGENDIIYVRTTGKFCYKTMLSLYKNVEKWGEGGYGSVFLFEHSLSGEKVAAKFMDVSDYLRKANEIEKALKESTSLIALDHDGIIKFETAFLMKNHIVMFTEYMPGGELGDYVKNNNITEASAKKIFLFILEAVHYCHTHGIIHRDLKMENILLKDNKDPFSLKIIDFGIAGIWSIYGADTSTAGTLYYSPPEVINETDIKSDPKIDIWALGVILYILLLKRYPFKGPSGSGETRRQILEDEITFETRAERKLSSEAKHLISMLLQKNKAQRYSMREIVSHPWLDCLLSNDKSTSSLLPLKSNLITKAIREEIKSKNYPVFSGTILSLNQYRNAEFP